MKKFILGTKLGMSQIFDKEGNVIPVTLIEIDKNVVTQAKTIERDGYEAVQVGTQKKKRLTKALAGHLKNLGNFRYLREFRGKYDLKTSDEIKINLFKEGDIVKISGISKGKGFQGVVKRHGFHGGPASHGQKDRLRAPGSIGPSFPEHVRKGVPMAGRMGGERVTVKNLKIVKVDEKNNLIAVKGALPGRRGTLLKIES